MAADGPKPSTSSSAFNVSRLSASLSAVGEQREATSSTEGRRQYSDDIKPFMKHTREKVDLDTRGIEDIVPFEPGTYTPERALEKGKVMLANLGVLLDPRNFNEEGQTRLETWTEQLGELKEHLSTQQDFLIAVVGPTGSGKSSMINALLDSESLVPTNSVRACTSVITEITYHDNDEIIGDVHFLSRAEWRDEVEKLRSDLVDEDGTFRRCTDENTEAGAAWAKLSSVYPEYFHQKAGGGPIFAEKSVEELMAYGIVATHLGTTERIVASSSEEFCRKVRIYIDSKEKDLGGKRKRGGKKGKEKEGKEALEYWPLIKKVRIHIKAKALSTGATLVDLPGAADSNLARGNIAREFMQHASAVWVCALQTRAVDDKVASDLMGSAFRRQLQMDGAFDRVTFITTSSDNVAPLEVMETMKELRESLTGLEKNIQSALSQQSENGLKEAAATTELKDAKAALRVVQADIVEWKKRLECKRLGKTYKPVATSRQTASEAKGKESDERDGSDDDMLDPTEDEESDLERDSPIKKRRITLEDSSDSDCSNDSSDSDESTSSEGEASSDEERMNNDDESDVEMEDAADGMDADTVQAVLEEKKEQERVLLRKCASVQKQLDACVIGGAKIEKKLAKLHSERNGKCALARNNYSRLSLQEDFRSLLQRLDEEAEQRSLGESWNPDVTNRDYDSISLPVFCVSSREYAKLANLGQDGGKPSVFSTLKETGIPALRSHCRSITLKPRLTRAKDILQGIADLASSVCLFLSAAQDGYQGQNKQELREAFDDRIRAVQSKLSQLAQDTQVMAINVFETKLSPHLAAGVTRATDVALATMQSHDRLPWNLYRAAMHRKGLHSWKKQPVNMNLDMARPLLDQISAAWNNIFTAPEQLIGTFKQDSLQVIQELADALAGSSSSSSHSQFDRVADQTKQELENRLSSTWNSLMQGLDTEQREASRSVESVIQNHLAEDYQKSSALRGLGVYKNMQAVMNDAVERDRKELFSNASTLLMEKLEGMADNVALKFQKTVRSWLPAITNNFSTLWLEHGRIDSWEGELRQELFVAFQKEEISIQRILEAAASPKAVDVESDVEEEGNLGKEEKQGQKSRKRRTKKRGKGKGKR